MVAPAFELVCCWVPVARWVRFALGRYSIFVVGDRMRELDDDMVAVFYCDNA